MRSSDWSSDVCSSDLISRIAGKRRAGNNRGRKVVVEHPPTLACRVSTNNHIIHGKVGITTIVYPSASTIRCRMIIGNDGVGQYGVRSKVIPADRKSTRLNSSH